MPYLKNYFRGALLIFFIHLSLVSFGQGVNLFPDAMGGFWFIEGNSVKRIDDKGQVLAFYSNILLGKPSSVDPTDPFRVLVFYFDSQTLVLINKDGVVIGKPINIEMLGLGEITLACRSSRGGIWLLHPQSLEIVRTDKSAKRIEHRFNLSPNTLNRQPNFMAEQGGILYLGLNNKTIATIDTYGSPVQDLDINYDNAFRINDDYIWSFHDGLAQKTSLLTLVQEFYLCTCHSLPIVQKEKVMCFDGVKFRNCEKIQE